MIQFLTGNGTLCEEEKAVLISKREKRGEFPKAQIQEHVRAYRIELLALMEAEAEKRPAVPIPIQQTATVAGYPLTWNGKNWEFETPAIRLKIEAQTDQQDLEKLLSVLHPIEEKILSRGIGKKKVEIEVGCLQWEDSKSTAAASLRDENLIWFPSSQTIGRLSSTCLETASQSTPQPVSLQGIILHEIGHLLEPQFENELTGLRDNLATHLGNIQEFLETVSPHYLVHQTPQIQKNLLEITSLQNKRLETTKIKGITYDLEALKQNNSSKITQELFAECVKKFFLEPIMGFPPPPNLKTTWPALNLLTSRLETERKKTISSEKTQSIQRSRPIPHFQKENMEP